MLFSPISCYIILQKTSQPSWTRWKIRQEFPKIFYHAHKSMKIRFAVKKWYLHNSSNLNFICFNTICCKSMSKKCQFVHTCIFNFKFASLILSRTAFNLSSYSSFEWSQTTTSSWLFLQPSKPSIISLVFRWNTSDALFTPNANRLNLYQPNGDWNVSTYELVSSNLIFQYPDDAEIPE